MKMVMLLADVTAGGRAFRSGSVVSAGEIESGCLTSMLRMRQAEWVEVAEPVSDPVPDTAGGAVPPAVSGPAKAPKVRAKK